jgi:hypothetical protein
VSNLMPGDLVTCDTERVVTSSIITNEFDRYQTWNGKFIKVDADEVGIVIVRTLSATGLSSVVYLLMPNTVGWDGELWWK